MTSSALLSDTSAPSFALAAMGAAASLADLYDPLTMPPELLKAHQANECAVMNLYGFSPGKTRSAECVAALMEMYEAMAATH